MAQLVLLDLLHRHLLVAGKSFEGVQFLFGHFSLAETLDRDLRWIDEAIGLGGRFEVDTEGPHNLVPSIEFFFVPRIPKITEDKVNRLWRDK